MAKARVKIDGVCRYMTTKELQAYTSLGRTAAEKLGITAGAKIKIGRSTRWDVVKVDEYMQQLAEV